MILFTLALTQI